MAINMLTDHKCRAAKPEVADYKLFDGHGLHLVVRKSGSKLWRVSYRLAGKQQTASLGPYPLLSLAAAREKRDELRLKLLSGERVRSGRSVEALTFARASAKFWASRKDVSPKYVVNAEHALARHLHPFIGDRLLDDIERADLLDALRRMDAAGLHVYVRKTRMWASQVFDWAVEQEFAKVNPARLINPQLAFTRAKVTNMAALELPQVHGFMARLDLEGVLQSAQACRLLALTALRTQELRMMKFAEIDGDLLRVPNSRMKKDLDLLVPLSRQALDVIDNMRARTKGSDYVFQNERRLDRPMSENAILYLMGRMGYGGQMTGHGWRSVFSSWANEAGYNPDAIERQLAHVPGDKVRGIYNRAEYLPERRAMLQAWADWLMPAGQTPALRDVRLQAPTV